LSIAVDGETPVTVLLCLEKCLVCIVAIDLDAVIRATSEVISFDPQVAWRYASLRGTHNIRNADAIQLACAAHNGVDLFITNDMQLHKLNVPGIGFIAPLDRVPL
jgi:predicted nucleic acid-binding protein